MATTYPILLIDDQQTIADILNRAAASVFPEADFIHVSSFSQAVAYLNGLAGRGPRLVLLDVNLQSELSGFDFLSLLRQHPQGRLVPVIVLSASREDSVSQEAYERGANAFTLKPFSYSAWKTYVKQLREFWFETATLPKLYFDEQAQEG